MPLRRFVPILSLALALAFTLTFTSVSFSSSFATETKSEIPTFEQFEEDPIFDAFMTTFRTAGNLFLVQYGLTHFKDVASAEALKVGAVSGVLAGAQQLVLGPMYQWQMQHGIIAPFKKGAQKAGMAEVVTKEYLYQLIYYSVVYAFQVYNSSGEQHLGFQPFVAAFFSLFMDGFLNLLNFRSFQLLKDKLNTKLQAQGLNNEDIAKIASQMRLIVRAKKSFAAVASVGGTFLAVMTMQENAVWAQYFATALGALGLIGTSLLYRDEIKPMLQMAATRSFNVVMSCQRLLSVIIN